ncbi:MAG: hypothetical protein A2X59_08760 [Nitrospirae bacterium GWC2_42_7]|nr:MAG: hypothetical protein A2X59_08760 [Nitrospirae bacterium GWC2_42_7]
MLVGYNTNITYKGSVYHVQTEDSGLKNPIIITLLYLKGTILSSKKTGYAEIAASPDFKEKVREIMKEQHKNMIKELVSGRLTSEVVPQTTGETALSEPVPSEPAVNSLAEPTAKGQIIKSLDDILLDYIIKRED